MVYIREAHALDGFLPLGADDGPILEDPTTLDERRSIARTCMARLDLDPIPALVDTLDDEVGRAYDAWPDRLYLIGTDRRVRYRSEPGPEGFRPDELGAAIRCELAQ